MHDQGIDLVDEMSSAELEVNNSHSLLFDDIILKYDAKVHSRQISPNDLSLGCQTSNSASSSIFHHMALLAFLVVLVLHSSNFQHWPLIALLVVLVLH